MPRFPKTSSAAASLGASVYSDLAHRLETYPGEIFPLHVGDTYLEPAEGCHMQDLVSHELPGLHRYAPPQGLPALLDALAERLEERSGVATSRAHLLVTTGATGALAAAVGALLEPGDQVLVPMPCWPLFPGIARSYHVEPVEVPLFDMLESPEAAVAALEQWVTPKTSALYLNTPNNPSGRVLPEAVLRAMVEWACDRSLWIFSDEVYEDYSYTAPHVPCRRLAPENTLAVHSFSKAYGMAGNRCGYIAGPADAIAALRRLGTHTFYSTPTAAQHAALRVLRPSGDAWLAETRAAYQEIGNATAARLGLPSPEGGTFLFFDVAQHLDARGLPGFLSDLADQGLFLAPGPSFGSFPTHIRLCFTAAPPDSVLRAVDLLASLLETSRKS